MKFLILLFLILHLTNEANFSIFGHFYAGFTNFLTSIRNDYNYSPNRRQLTNIPDEDYDFIIVGSGSAGCVIANRLSENPNWKILLLEAGSKANAFTEVPLVAPVFQLTPYNWGNTMEKQEGFCNAMEEGLCSWPRGRALGGTSVINYMIYTRGNPLDYKRWVAQGNPGWSYNEILPYYLKSENCNLGEECNSHFHKEGGYLNLEYPFTSKLTNIFLKAGVEMGEKIVDYNTPDYMGFSKIQANLKRGRRHSASAAFLDPIADRANLQILTSARVTKILINNQTKTAYGVEYVKNNETYTVRATKEVIISAGAFHSPQLLMLSGIGPQNHLEDLGIPLIQDLPVGETLYDHISYLGVLFTINQTIVSSTLALNPAEALKWFINGEGFYSSLGGVESLAYIKTDQSKDDGNYPDIELLLASIGSMQYDFGLISAPSLRVREDFYNEYFRPVEHTPCYSILPMLLHPKSKGHMKLRSKNPFDPPLFYGNYFTDPEKHDLKTMISAIRYIQNISRTKAFQSLNATLYDRPIPGCENFPFDSDGYWECAIRSLGVTLHHQISTCKMGPKNDTEAVVNNKLKVYGVRNLRVADTSIIPVTLSAHTNAPSIMIGEKVSDIIKNDWNRNG